MKQPAASPGRTEKQQQLPAPPGLARLLLSKSRRGGRSRRAPATSPMFVSRGRSRAAAGADGEPSSPKVTCIGQVRMRKGKKGGKKVAAGSGAPARASTPEKARGYCRCLKKAFLCGGLFGFDRGGRKHKAPSPVSERSRRSPWVFSSRDVAVAAAPKQPDPRSELAQEEEDDEEMGVGVGVFCSVEQDEAEERGINNGGKKEDKEADEAAELVSTATATPPKNALLLMRCRSAPQNRTSPLTARFAAANAPSPVQETVDFAVEITPTASARASPSPRKPEMVAVETDDEKWQDMLSSVAQEQEQQEARAEQEEQSDDYDEEEEAEELRCSSARPLVLPRCKSEPATTAAAKMAAGIGSEAAPSGCFWAHGGGSGRRRHAPPLSPVSAAPLALTGH
ncbi:uncharacterized protein LOC124706083 [Lolium rigidum]|uniref:uncharacterized protein LOC124706083 n=1 Tax=Lolium rigidum TaxID=89674 RepID=UPI001F5D3A4D|nr:uncharacterized protein LOC124706083 [Lolium rigidum]